MKKLLVLVFLSGLLLSACMPALPAASTGSPTPFSEAALQSTAAVLSEMTLQAMPTATLVPSETAVIVTPTNTPIPVTATETQNPFLLTLTATLGTGTVTATTGTPGSTAVAGTLPSTILPGTPHPLYYGTLPPDLPSGLLNLFNKSHVDAYISLRCVSKGGNVTILEYPVNRQVIVEAPAGSYTYVAWVGGRKFDGSFSLAQDDEKLISLFTDRITIK